MRRKLMCVDARLIASGGIGTYLQELLKRLKEELKIVALVFPKDFHRMPQGIDCIACSAPLYSWQEQLTLPLCIPTCDLLWSPHFSTFMMPCSAKKRLLTVHDLFHIAYYRDLRWHQKLYVKMLLPQMIKGADRLITVSEFSKREIEKTFRKTPFVIANGVDAAFFSSHQQGANEVQEKWGLKKPFFLFVGSDKPHKNLPRFMQAYRQLAARWDVDCVVVGSTKVRDRRIHCFKNIDRAELAALYHLAVALVFPSLYEGFGLPPLEAMACRCPVIVSSMASLPEICGEAAYYVNPYDSLHIANAMEEVMQNRSLREDLIAKGLQRVKQYSWDLSATQHLEVICESCTRS